MTSRQVAVALRRPAEEVRIAIIEHELYLWGRFERAMAYTTADGDER